MDMPRKQPKVDHIPKKGIINATPTEEMTSAVLRRMKHQKLLETLVGRSSSILLASGFISRAYLCIVKEANKRIHNLSKNMIKTTAMYFPQVKYLEKDIW